jgi:peptide deformylase
MALLPILEFPDVRLRNKAVPITEFTPELQQLIDDMFETMYTAPGIGLAASQVDRHIQMMVIDVSEEKNAPMVLINPKLSAPVGEQVYKEGCLSVPTVYADVKRADQITVDALDRFGKPFQCVADGLLAVCIQHEMDHLLGKMFVDYLSPLKRAMAMAKLEKLKRERAQKALRDKKRAASA